MLDLYQSDGSLCVWRIPVKHLLPKSVVLAVNRRFSASHHWLQPAETTPPQPPKPRTQHKTQSVPDMEWRSLTRFQSPGKCKRCGCLVTVVLCGDMLLKGSQSRANSLISLVLSQGSLSAIPGWNFYIAECRWAYGSRSEPPSHIINVNGAWES
ncbi:hypothetical protein TNCV_1839871 [Trichonephila clavipes]|nr:hypothetical protein TNCV_1839871 [Trichonephila clavipes]